MCGLAGIFTTSARSELAETTEAMVATIVHRGPDDKGIWLDAEAGIGLGFRRLAIIDLSEHGHQPMESSSGRYMMIYNGEVFNYRELRRDLEVAGWRFRGHSDTEVMLGALERWGVKAAATRFIGMFAAAVWDRELRALHLFRDRLGIKPLFVSASPGQVSFASELKALVAQPGFDRSIDLEALVAYLRYLYVPAPRSIYRSAAKLLPGHLITIFDPAQPLPPSERFWSAEEAARRGLAEPFEGSDSEAIRQLEALLTDAVERRMIADVPLGALLSGGIDSSTVVALMQAKSTRPVKTFTIGFDVLRYNEAAHAARVARHLGTEHTELMLSGEDALAVVPRLPDMFDEPLADPSQIPTFLVCALARKEVTVALSGDGGDELFAGYNRYVVGARMLPRLLSMPRVARRLVAAGIGTLPPAGWDRVHAAVTPVLPASLRHRLPGEKLHKAGRLMELDTLADMYRSLLSAWNAPQRLVPGGGEPADEVDRILRSNTRVEAVEKMMLADQLTYLPDDLLAKVDRASMAVSLEVRVPLLDHRVVEFAWRLPQALKIRNGQGKWLLRQVLYQRVPRQIAERPKMGFSVPINEWLRGPLRGVAEELLALDRLKREGHFDAASVRSSWESFRDGRSHEGLAIWAIFLFQAWRARWVA